MLHRHLARESWSSQTDAQQPTHYRSWTPKKGKAPYVEKADEACKIRFLFFYCFLHYLFQEGGHSTLNTSKQDLVEVLARLPSPEMSSPPMRAVSAGVSNRRRTFFCEKKTGKKTKRNKCIHMKKLLILRSSRLHTAKC